MRPQSGFTLLEIMVVVVIGAIVAVATTLSLGARGFDPELDEHGRRLGALLELASEEATLQAREYAVEFRAEGYAFHVFDPDTGEWHRLADDRLLRPRTLPEGTELTLSVEGRPVRLPEARAATPRPQVMLLSSGEITPFRAVISRRGRAERMIVEADATGRVTLSREAPPG